MALHSGEHRAVSLALLGLNLVRAAAAERQPRPDLISMRRTAPLPSVSHQPVSYTHLTLPTTPYV